MRSEKATPKDVGVKVSAEEAAGPPERQKSQLGSSFYDTGWKMLTIASATPAAA